MSNKRRSVAPPEAADGERLRAFAEIGADWFWEKDRDLRFTSMSRRIDGPAAFFAADFLGRRIEEVSFLGFAAIDWRPLLSALARRAPFRDFRFACSTDAGLRHIAVNGVPIVDGAGQFQGYRGTGRDVTAGILADAHAATAQARLVDAIECLPQSVAHFDREDRLVLCNSRYRALHAGISAALVPGTSFAEICHATARAALVADARGREDAWVRDRLARHRAPVNAVEERQIGERWFQISDHRTHEGGTVVVQTEITAAKRREHELAEQTALLRATLDHMEQGVLLIDAELHIRMWNERWIELIDLPAALIAVGNPLEPVVRFAARRGDYGAGEVEPLVAQRLGLMRQPALRDAAVHVTPTRVIEVRRRPMPGGGALFTYADITEDARVEADLRRAKDEAELASRTKTEFLANMSHELRTPLNAIIGFSDILMGQIFGPLGDARYDDYARDIRDSGLHLLNLINDVLDMSKVEFGKVELVEETVDVIAIIQSCARLMRDRAAAAGLRLVLELPPGLPPVLGDSRRLKQILLNLLSNAVKFTPRAGSVAVRAAAGEDGLRLVVEDTGIGIARQDLDQAMRRFGQIDSRLARKYEGTGLGLPLARSMAELHGGTLEIDSTPGQGTRVTLWLPASRVRAPADAKA